MSEHTVEQPIKSITITIDSGGIQYFTLTVPDYSWTINSLKALRFAREEDAGAFAESFAIKHDRIAEHRWG